MFQKGGMQKFRNIEKLNNLGVYDSEAGLDTENLETVEIVTIHGSKDIEFKCYNTGNR